jgi:type III pantothenate kinase
MLLVVDIGNTNITLGIFNDECLIDTLRLISDENFTIKEYEMLLKSLCEKYNIKSCVIGSVFEELNLTIKQAIDNVFNINSILITKNSKFGIDFLLKNSETAGIDRIANAVYAKENYKLPAIIVDIGTAITLDVVSKDKIFLGGAIMPGINMQLDALFKNTSKLPQVEPKFSEKAIGNSTEDAILSGVMRGIACAVEGLIKQCEIELSNKTTIIATGGQCELIAKYLSRKFDFVDKAITLKGLKIFYELNKILD